MNLEYFKGNNYEIMARRIQRAWRRYRTHKLVQRYANYMCLNFGEESPRNNSERSRNEE